MSIGLGPSVVCVAGAVHRARLRQSRAPPSQAPDVADAELQTEYLEPTSAVRLVHDDFLDSSELNSFLMECRDGLEETLLRNVQSKAFDTNPSESLSRALLIILQPVHPPPVLLAFPV